MPPKGHAVCSPSSAERWINCPPSAQLNAMAEKKDTPFTLEGTLAHAVCETKAKNRFFNLNERLDFFHSDPYWTEEMEGYTDRYIECLTDFYSEFPIKPAVYFERRLDFGAFIPESFGTADCIMLDDETIHVIDFKYGKGVAVSAERNPQLMIYALGALKAMEDMFEFSKVRISIVQPRINHDPSTWELSVQELLDWAEKILRPAAKLAFEGEGEFKPGSWCKWCCCNGECRAQFWEFVDYERKNQSPADTLSPEELGEAIKLGERLSVWIDAVKAHALNALLDGEEIHGWKAVEGRSNRVWADMEGAFAQAKADGIPEEMLYERSPISLSALEKIVGKKKFSETMSKYVSRPEGKPTLAPVTDKRDPITRKASAQDDFAK